MKYLFAFLVTFYSFSHPAVAQALPPEIERSWKELKIALQLRSDFILGIPASVQHKATPGLRRIFEESREMAIDFNGYIAKQARPDSSSLQITLRKTNRIAINISRIAHDYRQEAAIRDHDFFRTITEDIQRIDNKIAVAVGKYNQLCRQYNRSDLLFGEEK